MARGVLCRLAPLALAIPAALLAGCESELNTSNSGPRFVSIVAASGLGQSGIVGGLLGEPLVVLAQDQYGLPVAGEIIEWSVIAGGGHVDPSQSTTGADGLAQTSFRLGIVLGQQSVRAELRGTQPVVFTATASSAPASQLTIVAGDNQSARFGGTLPVQLAVKVTDAFNNVKSGITVVFTVLAGGGTLSSPSAVTGPDGIARIQWTLGPLIGTQLVSASVDGVAPVTFTATATP